MACLEGEEETKRKNESYRFDLVPSFVINIADGVASQGSFDHWGIILSGEDWAFTCLRFIEGVELPQLAGLLGARRQFHLFIHLVESSTEAIESALKLLERKLPLLGVFPIAGANTEIGVVRICLEAISIVGKGGLIISPANLGVKGVLGGTIAHFDPATVHLGRFVSPREASGLRGFYHHVRCC